MLIVIFDNTAALPCMVTMINITYVRNYTSTYTIKSEQTRIIKNLKFKIQVLNC